MKPLQKTADRLKTKPSTFRRPEVISCITFQNGMWFIAKIKIFKNSQKNARFLFFAYCINVKIDTMLYF